MWTNFSKIRNGLCLSNEVSVYKTKIRRWTSTVGLCCLATSLLACGSSGQPLVGVSGRRRVTVIYRGTNYVGGSFRVQVNQPGLRPVRRERGSIHEIESAQGCADLLVVVEDGRNGASGETCLSEGAPAGPSVVCDGTSLTIELFAEGNIQKIALMLHKRPSIAGKVIRVPRGLGGPMGFYYQRVPSSARPIALAEFDGRGNVVRTVTLPQTPRCGSDRKRQAFS